MTIEAQVESSQEVPIRKWVGTQVRRVEDPRHLLGKARFVGDVSLPGQAHIAFLRSTEPHAWITDINIERALSTPGVWNIFTGADLAGVFSPIIGDIETPGARHAERPVVASKRVRFVGEIIGVVVAESRYVAEDALGLIDVSYEPLTAVACVEDAMRSGAPLLHDDLGWDDNCMLHVRRTYGDVDAAFEGRRTIKWRFRSGRVAATALEPRGCLAQSDERTGTVTVWSSTQIPHILRSFIGRLTGLPESRLRVIALDVGGGFGQKGAVYPEEAIVAYLSKAIGRPVKWMSDRREDLLSSHQAREHEHVIEAAFDDDGIIHGIKAVITADIGAYSICPWSGAMEAAMAASNLPGPYKFQNYAYEHFTVTTNKAPLGPYRGVGRPAACFSIERTIDEVAHALDMDPLELRLRNTVRTYPHRTASGMVLDSGTSLEALERIKDVIEPHEFGRFRQEAREDGRYVGIGLAQYAEQTGHSMVDKGLTVDASFESATIQMEPDGQVVIFSGSLSHGQGHETTFAQLAADELGVPFEQIRVVQGDTAAVPYGIGTFASRSAVLGGGAVIEAAGALKEKLRTFAGRQLEVSKDDLVLADGGFHVKGAPARSIPLTELAWLAYSQAHLMGDLGAGLSATKTFSTLQPTGAFANSLHAAVVEVDLATGAITILRYVVIHDCGTVINPLIVDGQVHGGTVQGLGQALLEHIVYGEDGQPATTTLMDYLLPGITEMPMIETYHDETPAPKTYLGIKGMGEGGAIGPPPAIANAVSDALRPLQVHITEIPLSPERVLRAVADAQADALEVVPLESEERAG